MDRIRIVVADSDWSRARLVKYSLENKDIQVVEVSQGLDCLKILCQEGGDFVILDANLPDLNGRGILTLLRMTPSFRDLPVILLSDDIADSALLRQLRPGGFVRKPFEVRDLVLATRKVIEEKTQSHRTGTSEVQDNRGFREKE
mgnify:CR=1 FL=1